MDNFFSDLPVFDDFNAVSRSDRFGLLPADWVILVADIRGSTEIVAQGRYQDVNLIGAACIQAVRGALKDLEFPFVFGGDGEHIHFIDGAEGGYALAALQLKAQQHS